MSTLAEEISNTTRQLRLLQEQLEEAAAASKRTEPVPVPLIEEFKAAVDHTRHLLWCYIEAAAANSGLEFDQALQVYRERRVAEMLHLMKPKDTQNRSGSFFEDVSTMVGDYLDQPPCKRAG